MANRSKAKSGVMQPRYRSRVELDRKKEQRKNGPSYSTRPEGKQRWT